MGFDASSCGVSVSIGQQSADIAHGVERSLEAREGASAVSYTHLDVYKRQLRKISHAELIITRNNHKPNTGLDGRNHERTP